MEMTPEQKAMMEQMRSDIELIKHALLGNKEMGIKGAITRIDSVEEKQEKMDNFLKAGRWIGTGFILAAAYGAKQFLVNILEYLKPH